MSKTVNDYMKPLMDGEAKANKRKAEIAKDLEELRTQRAALDAELDAAFAADDMARYDELFAQRAKLNEQLESRASYLDRAVKTYTDTDVNGAWNEYLATVANKELTKKISDYTKQRTELAKLLLEIVAYRQRIIDERSTMSTLLESGTVDLAWPVMPPFNDFQTVNRFFNGVWSAAEQTDFCNIVMHGGAAM